MKNLAERLAQYAANLQFDHIDPTTVHEVKRRLIDSLSCALGAYRADAVGVARRIATRVTGHPGANFFGGENQTSPDLATFVNGVLFRYLDYNDTYLSLEPAHPSDNFAAVLAAAQFADRSGRDIITATVIAYEIQCRLCDAASIRARGWDHVTYGAFSTAAAAAKLLDLSAEKIRESLNLAGAPNVTLRQTRSGELSHWKGCAFANASRNGVFAAMLAAEGLTGPSPIFEGEMGFFHQVSGPFDVEHLGGEQDDHDFMINRTSIKFWPAEYHSQSAIHAALELRKQLPNPGTIAEIEIASFDAAVDIIGKDPEKWRPRTRETADHSLPYCTVVALVDGDVTLQSFSDERLRDETLLDLVQKTKVVRDDALSACYPQTIPNRLTVTLEDGQQLTAENATPRGHDQNPMSDDEVVEKFQRMASDLLDVSAQQQILDFCWNLEQQSSVDGLFELFPKADC